MKQEGNLPRTTELLLAYNMHYHGIYIRIRTAATHLADCLKFISTNKVKVCYYKITIFIICSAFQTLPLNKPFQ